MRAGGCRGVGHSDGGTAGGSTGADGRRRDAVHTIGIGQRQGHVALEVGTGHGEGLAHCLAGGGAERQCAGRYTQRRGGARCRRLDADDHLLIDIEVVAAVAERVERAPGIAIATPTEVDVILVGAAVVAIDVEGVATGV